MANQPVWNSADKDSGCTLSNSDKTAAQAASNAGSVRSTTSLSAGKWYIELNFGGGAAVNSDRHRCGVANGSANIGGAAGDDANAWVIQGNGQKRTGNSATAYGDTVDNPLRVAIDLDNGKIWFGESTSTWFNSGDPAAGTNAAFTGLSGALFLIFGGSNTTGSKIGTLIDVASYTGSPPSGFTAGWGATATTYPQTLSASLTGTASIRRTTSKSVSATLTGTASIRRTTTKIVSATCALTASIRRTIAKTVSATASLTGAILKTVGKTLSGTLPLTASLTRATVYSRALSATLSLTGGMSRTVEKVISGTIDLTAGMTRTVGKTLSATIDLTASLARALGVTLVATIGLSASMVRTIGKVLTGELPLVPDLGKIKAALVTMSADLTMTASMTAGALFTRVMEATISFSASMSRTIDKVMTAALPVVSKPLLWVATILGALRNDKPNWNQCARCNKPTRPNKLIRQMEYRGPRLVWTGLYVCDLCLDDPQPQNRTPRMIGGDPRPVPNARPRKS